MGEGLCLSGATVRSVVEQSVFGLNGYKLLVELAHCPWGWCYGGSVGASFNMILGDKY